MRIDTETGQVHGVIAKHMGGISTLSTDTVKCL